MGKAQRVNSNRWTAANKFLASTIWNRHVIIYHFIVMTRYEYRGVLPIFALKSIVYT